MCPCQPLDDSKFHPPSPPAGTNGFAVSIPPLNIQYPPINIPDLTALINSLSIGLPSGTLHPGLEADVLNKPLSAFLKLLDYCVPFLMLYKFLLPIPNLILCMIEVLCAIPNPFKLSRAITRLFRNCLPDFLSIFPYLALIIMIITLLLLIIALIEYLIQRIINIINTIINNIKILAQASARLDNDSIIGITKKVGDLLCLMQNLFVILGIILLIVDIIEALLGLTFSVPPCSSSNGSADGCCTPDVCPAFLKNNSDGITSSTGFFQYFPEVGIDSGLTLPPGFPLIIDTIRAESWQFYDPNLVQDQQFINITNAFDLPSGTNTVFFPPGTNYTASTAVSNVPYTINFRIFYNPLAFGRVDPKGARFVAISNAIVQSPPTKGVLSYNGQTYIAPFDGTLNLIGGSITEDDGVTVIRDSNNNPYTIATFFHQAVNANGPTPQPTDGILYSNITYTFNINYEALIAAALITIGCLPSVAVNRDFINTTLGNQLNSTGAALSAALLPGGTSPLPDVAGAQNCIANAVATFQQSISIESATALQTSITNCLNGLTSQASAALASTIGIGFNPYTSKFGIDTPIQFTTRPITVSVEMNESSGQLMTSNLPASVANTIAANLSVIVTLGSVSSFQYDGYNLFNAEITSQTAGNGIVKVLYDNNYISTLTNPASIDESPMVLINSLEYTFVEAPVAPGGQPRRDISDIAGSGE